MIPLIHTFAIAALLLSAASCILALRRQDTRAQSLLIASWGASGALFLANWALADALPFGNMRHVLCFFPLVLTPASLYLRHCRGYKLTAYFAAAAALSLAGALSMPLQAAWRQMPALQSPWFAPHVTSYVIAYGLLTVSALLLLRPNARQQQEQQLGAADAVVRLAFPFLTFGLWSGALWADAAWGRYWAWDIKEVWSLITWLIYLIYFHLEQSPAFAGWRRPLLLLGFLAVLITFFVVNLLPHIESIHSYAAG